LVSEIPISIGLSTRYPVCLLSHALYFSLTLTHTFACFSLSCFLPPLTPSTQLSASAELSSWAAAQLTALAALRFTDDEAAVYRTPKGTVYRSPADIAKKEAAEAAAAAKKKPAASAGMWVDFSETGGVSVRMGFGLSCVCVLFLIRISGGNRKNHVDAIVSSTISFLQ
jgi:hypothetical protein